MAGSLVSRTRTAVRRILDSHPSVVAVTGRPKGNCLPFKSKAREVGLPILLYHFIGDGQSPSSERGSTTLLFQITAIADGQDATDKVESLVDAVNTALILPAFAEHGLEGCIIDARRADESPDDNSRDLERADLTLGIWVMP